MSKQSGILRRTGCLRRKLCLQGTPAKMIYYVNCDGHGLDSVRNVIRDNSKEITVIDGGTFKSFNDNVTNIKYAEGDTFIVDTISELSANLIREYRFRNMKDGESFERYYNTWDSTNSQSAYAMAEQ